jgi:hypothetical protein
MPPGDVIMKRSNSCRVIRLSPKYDNNKKSHCEHREAISNLLELHEIASLLRASQ